MLIKAILIVDTEARIAGGIWSQPPALTEILGHTLIEHVARHLRRHGIAELQAVSRAGVSDLTIDCLSELREAAAAGVDVALVIDAAHYAEVDWEAAIAHHLQHSQRLTNIKSSEGEILREIIVTPALIPDPFEPETWGTRGTPYQMRWDEYSVSLDRPAGWRQLAGDALHRVCSLDVNGHEARPGIWIGHRARIEKGARLVAPVYIGRRSRVRAGAVVTRGSSVEQHCMVDCGTIVDAASVLPFTELGPGLDARNSIVGEGAIFNLHREVAVAIADGKIIRQRSRSALARVVESAGALAAFLPRSIVQGLRQPELPASAPTLSGATCANLKPEPRAIGKFNPGLAVVRRYGNE